MRSAVPPLLRGRLVAYHPGMSLIANRTLGLALLLILPTTFGCKSKEEKACLAQAKWTDELARPGDPPSPKMEGEELSKCVAAQKRYKLDFKLDDAQYEAFLDCEIAATDMNDWMDCLGDLMKIQAKTLGDELDLEVNAMQEAGAQAAAAAITRLEAHVESGAVSAETIASLRARDNKTPEGRVEAVVDDAIALIEAGRVGADNPLTIRLQPGLNPLAEDEQPTPKGLDAAEISFVERESKATVARLAPISTDHFGAKNIEIAAMLTWMLEQPDTRQVELIVTSGTGEGIVFNTPDALYDLSDALEQAGLADRPIIWLDGKPMTRSQYIMR